MVGEEEEKLRSEVDRLTLEGREGGTGRQEIPISSHKALGHFHQLVSQVGGSTF